MDTYTFTKQNVDEYNISLVHGDNAIFTINSKERLMQCHSSYGSWSCKWRGCQDFKEYLISIESEWEYLLDRVSNKVFDFEKTMHEWKKMIVRWRKSDYCTKEQARGLFNFINESDDFEGEAMIRRLADREEIHEMGICVWEECPIERSWNGNDLVFAQTLFPILCQILREEIKEGADK